MKKHEQLEAFAAAAVCMDMYKQKFDTAKAKKEERFKRLNQNYKAGSPLFVEERNKITPDFNKEVEDARTELLSEFEDILDKTIVHEKAKVTVVTGSTKELLGTLKYLQDMPVSVDEYTTLTDSFGGKFYWIDRFLEKVADNNGIKKTGVQPSLTVKLEVLETLAENVRNFINEYDGEDKVFSITSSDKYIFSLEDKFTNGYAGIYLDAREQAKRMVSNALNKGDSLERGVTIANMLRTSTPEMQEEILSILAENDYPALSDPTMNFVGVKDVIDRFRKQDGELVKAADDAIDKVNSVKSRPECLGIVFDNLDNRHFRKRIEEKISNTGNEELKEIYENAREIKKEEEK